MVEAHAGALELLGVDRDVDEKSVWVAEGAVEPTVREGGFGAHGTDVQRADGSVEA